MTATPGRHFFNDLGVQVKMGLTVAVGVIVAIAVGALALHSLSGAAAAARHIYADNVLSVGALGQVQAAIGQARVDLANHLISRDAAATAKYAKAFETDLAAFVTAIATYRAGNPAGEVAAIDALQTDWNAYVGLARTKMLTAGERKDVEAWQTTRDTQVVPVLAKIAGTMTALRAAEAADAKAGADAAEHDYTSSRLSTIGLLTVGSLAAIALGMLVARGIARSLNRVRAVCEGLAGGDLTGHTGLSSADEPGRMGRALDIALTKLRGTVGTIDSSATSLSAATVQMTGVAERIATSADETSAQAQTVSAAAEQISRSVDTVSAGSEEMGASIREISLNATQAAQVAGEAVDLAARTSATMNQLGESSSQIGNVIKTITAIAQQTNLLALNATIEAARAGEAGKGFAVVAAEVKDLAQETARATEDISRRVETIQTDTSGAVVAIEEITRVIARISDFQTTIASAVEEQTATTAEMNRSVSEAATGTGDIAQTITGVADSARHTTEGVEQSRQATAELARMSADLTSLVATFRF
jgi:methyl-accepting chemotaxis protein